jgi:hypothetical protein
MKNSGYILKTFYGRYILGMFTASGVLFGEKDQNPTPPLITRIKLHDSA